MFTLLRENNNLDSFYRHEFSGTKFSSGADYIVEGFDRPTVFQRRQDIPATVGSGALDLSSGIGGPDASRRYFKTPVRNGAEDNMRRASSSIDIRTPPNVVLPQFARGTRLVQLAQQKRLIPNSGSGESDLDHDNGELDDHCDTNIILRAEDGTSVPIDGVFVVNSSEV